MYRLIFFISLVFVGCKNKAGSNEHEINHVAQIDSVFQVLKNNSISDSVKEISLSKASQIIYGIKNDSLRTKLYLKLSYYNLLVGNIENFKNINLNILDNSSIKSGSLEEALVHEYLGYYFQRIYKLDSAFYYYSKAFKSYNAGNNNIYIGRTLLNMATIQENVKDYTGSEINTIKAISKLNNSNEYRNLYLAYNNLGVVYNKLEKFDLAIESNRKAIQYLQLNGGDLFLKAMTLNNIGWVYSEMGDFQKSIDILREALKTENLFKNRSKTYAHILANLAYSKFKLGDETELPKLFYKSLKIRDSLQLLDGVVESSLHLSEYFLSKIDTLSAYEFAQKAEGVAVKSNYNDGLLESYLLLSKLEPGEKGKTYLYKYIKLSDSLQQREREIREKFTRIAYETGEIEKENRVITKKNWLLTITLVIGVALFIMVIIYLRQRTKNKELIFNQKQEEADTEIFNLMISEKKKFQEGSSKERIRISEELHDNIVNKLFGTRLALSLINTGISEDEIENWEVHIESLRSLEEEIRTLSHELKVEEFNIDNTFKKMVEELVKKRSKITNFKAKIDFNIVSDWENISNKIKIHCYRSLQETLHNIHKYANATKVSISFTELNEILYVEISDNGVGFDPSLKTKGIGLKNIESRIEKIGGEVAILSSQGDGTKISMSIPVKKNN